MHGSKCFDASLARFIFRQGAYFMPHITVQMYPGRDDAKKKKLADELVKAASAALDVPEKSFSVSILDVPQEEWTEKVYKDAIDPENKTIYRRPGY